MTIRKLVAPLERASINMTTGEFPMTLATDGEASDGDILSIEGGRFPKRAPLQNAHAPTGTDTLGSITGFERDLSGTPKRLRAQGQIEMGGEGVLADVRRDIAFMIDKGHISGVSVRWQPIEWVRRINLPSDHPAFVDEATEKDFRKRYGLFYKKWELLEGSIAPVQADKKAVIGRAGETEGEVAAFWRDQAEAIEEEERPVPIDLPEASDFDDHFEFCRAALPVLSITMSADAAQARADELWSADEDRRKTEETAGDPEETDETTAADGRSEETAVEEGETAELDPATAQAVAGARLRELAQELGLSPEDISTIAAEQAAPPPTTEERLEAALARIDALEAELLGAGDQDRVSGEPVPPRLNTTQKMFDYLDARMRETNRKALAVLQAHIHAKRGKVMDGQTAQQRLEAEANALLEEMRRAEGVQEGPAPDLGPMLLELDRRLEDSRQRVEETIRRAVAEATTPSD